MVFVVTFDATSANSAYLPPRFRTAAIVEVGFWFALEDEAAAALVSDARGLTPGRQQSRGSILKETINANTTFSEVIH